MGKLKSIKAKLIIWRTLKIASYLVGFPLLYWLCKLEFNSLGGVMSGANIGLNIVLYSMLAVIFVQIVVAVLLRNKKAKAIIVVAIATTLMLAPLAYIEFGISKKFEELQEKYQTEHGYKLDSMAEQATTYKDRVSNHNEDFLQILSMYNIEENSKVYAGSNTDLTPYTRDLDSDIFLDGFNGREHYIFGKDAGDAAYSMNGLYADGYIFGYKQAHYILKTYYETRAKYESLGKDIDEELKNAIIDLAQDPNSDWNEYRLTEDFLRAYGDEKMTGKVTIGDNEYDEALIYAKSYYVTPERIDAILAVLAEKLGEAQGIDPDTGKPKSISDLLAAVESILIVAGLGDYADLLDLSTLTLDKILSLIDSIEIEGFELTGDDLMELLADFSSYQSPTTYPVFYFIDNEELRDYAYAKYLGGTHGTKVASALIGDKVGKISLDDPGNDSPGAGIVARLDNIAIEKEYMPMLYPYLAIKNLLMIFAGIVPLSLIFAYAFAALEDKEFSKLMVKQGDR